MFSSCQSLIGAERRIAIKFSKWNRRQAKSLSIHSLICAETCQQLNWYYLWWRDLFHISCPYMQRITAIAMGPLSTGCWSRYYILSGNSRPLLFIRTVTSVETNWLFIDKNFLLVNPHKSLLTLFIVLRSARHWLWRRFTYDGFLSGSGLGSRFVFVSRGLWISWGRNGICPGRPRHLNRCGDLQQVCNNEKGHCNSHDSNFICLFHRTTKDQQYERMLSGLEKAAKEGLRNAPCSLLYKCPL